MSMTGTTNISIGTSSIQVLGAHTKRNYVLLTNENGAGEIYLAVGTNAVRGGGICLTSKGSTYEITRDNYVTNNITAIGSSTIALNLAILTY